MKSSIQRLASTASLLSVLLLQGAQLADGHYGFPVVVVNGVASDWFEFVRPVESYEGYTGTEKYGGIFWPIMDWTGEPQVCGIGATKSGSKTGTIKVEAGTEIGFQAFSATWSDGPAWPRKYNPSVDGIGHQGPGQAYMSKAPADLESYTGDGEWFKIGALGASDGWHWDTDGKEGMNFTIPKTTPPGKYLLRVEHFNISPYFNNTQQFINCAHVEVTGPGGGTPGPTIKFPGAYDLKDNGIWLPTAMYNPYKPTELLKKYKGPGPAVWKG